MRRTTAAEKEALSILAEIVGGDFYVRDGRLLMRGEQKTITDLAAKACGMIHRDGHLLTRQSAAVQLRGRHWVPAECLINSI